MAIATLTEAVHDVAGTIRNKVEDAEKAARKLRRDLALDDYRDEAIYRVKRQPVKALGLAFVAGALLGVFVGRLSARPCERTGDSLVS